jgi:hypothetical protein
MQTTRRTSPRAEYRLAQGLRAKESVSLGQKFPQLKSLTVNVAYFDSEGVTKNGEMKYKVNVEHAKSVFCFVCPSGECVGGDFDLSEELAKAVGARRKLAIGELRCQGWRRKAMVDRAPCHNLLRYKLTFEYARRSAAAA